MIYNRCTDIRIQTSIFVIYTIKTNYLWPTVEPLERYKVWKYVGWSAVIKANATED